MNIKTFISEIFKVSRTSENLHSTPIHPLFIQIKEKANQYLLDKGYYVFRQDRGIDVYKNDFGIFLSIVNQGYDFPEVYIGKSEKTSEMIRIDFILELYITGKNELQKKHKSLNNFYDFEYEKDFIELNIESILKIIPFPTEYKEWIQANYKLIKKQQLATQVLHQEGDL